MSKNNKLSDEMILRYLYYLTNQYAGTEDWASLWNAWERFAVSADNYCDIFDALIEFDNKYRIKKP